MLPSHATGQGSTMAAAGTGHGQVALEAKPRSQVSMGQGSQDLDPGSFTRTPRITHQRSFIGCIFRKQKIMIVNSFGFYHDWNLRTCQESNVHILGPRGCIVCEYSSYSRYKNVEGDRGLEHLVVHLALDPIGPHIKFPLGCSCTPICLAQLGFT